MSWLAENAATIVIGSILLVAVIFAIRYVVKKAKKGQCIGCDGHCSNGCCCSISNENSKQK